MKKISFVIVILMLLINNLTAQEGPKNSVRVHPVYAALNAVKIDYERMVKPKGAIELKLTFTRLEWDTFDNSLGDYRGEIALLNAGYKFYLSKKKNGPRGFFLRPGVVGGSFSIKEKFGENELDAKALGFGGEIGYQWVFNKFIKGLTIGTSFEVNKYFYIDKKGTSVGNVDPVIPELNISIGYSW
ncbi:hypothetical protein AWE51_20430 [Aquimarina aggregata]|uniref:DUF3575 domain-containing protein n=1 Tax=Aquimarina aggregata TaxID=1642818 RepID=A0A162CT36_9FLAO|nr:DUF3575 domain-containing protein [Aquimarina aggregata]KZS41764.1 hypothetical protein AWE51_20430 [Aquimarina aggregata]